MENYQMRYWYEMYNLECDEFNSELMDYNSEKIIKEERENSLILEDLQEYNKMNKCL
jgi:hypothetical protein